MQADYAPANADSLFDPIRRVYLFWGEEDLLKEEALQRLEAAAIDPSFAEFDRQAMDLSRCSPSDLLSAAGMAPLASRFRLVIARSAELLRRRENGPAAERLAQGIAGLGPQSCLALVASAGEEEASRGRTALHPQLDTAVETHGAVVRFRAWGPEELLRWLHAEAKQAGKSLSEEAGRALLRAAGSDRRALRNELEKSICFAGDSPTITGEMVEETAVRDPEDTAFRLVDAVSQRNADRALQLYREMLRHESRPQAVAGRLLALLGRQLGLLWQAHHLAMSGVTPAEVRALPGDLKEQLPSEGSIAPLAWKAPELFRVARAWDRRSLARAYALLAECDVNNKGGGEGSEEAAANLEILLVKLSGLASPPARRTGA